MKPTNNNEEIFPCTKCGNHAQPPIKTESRKKVIFHDYGANEERYLSLTDDQIRLLDYFRDDCGFDYSYDIVEQETFQEI